MGEPAQHREGRAGSRAREHRQAQPARRLVARRGLGLRADERGPVPRALRSRLRLDRLRAVHPGRSARRARASGPVVVGTGHGQGVRDPLLRPAPGDEVGPGARGRGRERCPGRHERMSEQVFNPKQGPREVRAAVQTQTSVHEPIDTREEIEEREGPLAVGRMRLMGVYDDRQRNRFMLRTRIPGGRISAEQLETVAGVIRDFGNGWENHAEPDRFGEITTRQDIQIHWVEFTQLPEIWRRYDEVGLTSAQACGDSMRNPTSCPADALDLFVTPDRVTDMVRATLQTYCDLGDFEHKAVNRFRVLVHQLGPERITDELRGRVPYEVPGAGESLWTGEFEDHLGVHE